MGSMLRIFENNGFDDEILPDNYHLNKNKVIQVNKDFIISRSKNGKILSIYGDKSWDISPYSNNPTKSSKLRFHERINEENLENEAKRLVFLLLIFGVGVNGSTYSVSTILGHATFSIFPASLYSKKNNISLNELFSNNEYLTKFIRSDFMNDIYLYRFYGFLLFLNSLDNKVSGFNYKEDKFFLLELKNIIKNVPAKFKQTPIIPTRIFSESLEKRWEQITEIKKNIRLISALLEASLDKTLNFKELKKQTNTEDIANKYGLLTRINIIGFVRKIQGTCKHLIHAYTGMRNSEVLNLHVNCIETIDNTTTRLISTTTKLEGRLKIEKWVTSKKINVVINILEELNESVYRRFEISLNNKLLFINASYFTNKQEEYEEQNIKSLNFNKNEELPIHISINENDLKELEESDPFRDWRSEENFNLGQNWYFKSHQYRRSLAVYSLQSGLVSLGSLQNQMKHLFREMTLYYGNGASRAKRLFDISKYHIGNDLDLIKPEIDAISYINNVIFSDEQLFGTHGTFVEKNIKEKKENKLVYLLKNREKTIQQFKNGDIAYKETAVGGCMSLDACDFSLCRSLIACAGCDSSVVKMSKFENVILEQKKYIENYLDRNSPEYRTELLVLRELENQRKQFLGRKK